MAAFLKLTSSHGLPCYRLLLETAPKFHGHTTPPDAMRDDDIHIVRRNTFEDEDIARYDGQVLTRGVYRRRSDSPLLYE